MTTGDPRLSSQIILPQPQNDREREIFQAIADRDKEIVERIEELDNGIGWSLGVDLSSLNMVGDPGFEKMTRESLLATPSYDVWYQSKTANGIVEVSTNRYSGIQAAKCYAPDTGDRSSVRQTLPTLAAGDYVFQFWTAGDGTHAGSYQLYQPTASPIPATSTGVTGTGFSRITAPFTALNESAAVILWSPVGAAGGAAAYFDHVLVAPAITYGSLDDVVAQIVRAIQLLAGDQ